MQYIDMVHKWYQSHGWLICLKKKNTERREYFFLSMLWFKVLGQSKRCWSKVDWSTEDSLSVIQALLPTLALPRSLEWVLNVSFSGTLYLPLWVHFMFWFTVPCCCTAWHITLSNLLWYQTHRIEMNSLTDILEAGEI